MSDTPQQAKGKNDIELLFGIFSFIITNYIKFFLIASFIWGVFCTIRVTTPMVKGFQW